MVANVAERMFRVDNPEPKPGLRRILREERRRAGCPLGATSPATPTARWRAFG